MFENYCCHRQNGRENITFYLKNVNNTSFKLKNNNFMHLFIWLCLAPVVHLAAASGGYLGAVVGRPLTVVPSRVG